MKNYELEAGSVALLGIPFDENSSFMRGAARGPAAIREILNNGASNLCTESGFDLAESDRWRDIGDIADHEIESTVTSLVGRDIRTLILGGDHSILYPIINAMAPTLESLTIIQLDAHPDLYDELDGNRFSHACPAARIMEKHPNTRLIQIGIRTLNTHQKEQADRFGVEIIPVSGWTQNRRSGKLPKIDGPVYLSLDLDVLDPAFAPGVSHHEPGGLSTRDVIDLIQSIKNPMVGADIVELNPDRDPTGITAAAATKLLKEILDRMLNGNYVLSQRY